MVLRHANRGIQSEPGLALRFRRRSHLRSELKFRCASTALAYISGSPAIQLAVTPLRTYEIYELWIEARPSHLRTRTRNLRKVSKLRKVSAEEAAVDRSGPAAF